MNNTQEKKFILLKNWKKHLDIIRKSNPDRLKKAVGVTLFLPHSNLIIDIRAK